MVGGQASAVHEQPRVIAHREAEERKLSVLKLEGLATAPEATRLNVVLIKSDR